MNYIVFDLEATCEDPMIDPDFDKEIIEIGAVKIKNGKIKDTFDVFVKPIKKPILTDFCKILLTFRKKMLIMDWTLRQP